MVVSDLIVLLENVYGELPIKFSDGKEVSNVSLYLDENEDICVEVC